MLGRKDYTQAEFDQAKAAIEELLAAYRALARKADAKTLEKFEPLFLNALTLTLDRFFVHRIRPVTGKDGNPVNEVEVLTESLMTDGVLRPNKVIKLNPDQSVTKLQFGDPIRLNLAQFEQLADAFFADLHQRFVSV